MKDEKKRRRQAMMLSEHIMIIDVNERELELIRKGELAIEKVKQIPNLVVYRRKR